MKKMLFLAILTPLFLCLSAQSEKLSPSVLEKLTNVSSSVAFKVQKEPSALKLYSESLMSTSPLPLIFVNDNIYERDINSINPIEADSITIFKDTAATISYGVLGKNGVIAIKLRTKIVPNTPLIIVNGLPREDMSSISSHDIESTTILTGAAAKDVYGLVGERKGVIVITTKEQKVQQ